MLRRRKSFPCPFLHRLLSKFQTPDFLKSSSFHSRWIFANFAFSSSLIFSLSPLLSLFLCVSVQLRMELTHLSITFHFCIQTKDRLMFEDTTVRYWLVDSPRLNHTHRNEKTIRSRESYTRCQLKPRSINTQQFCSDINNKFCAVLQCDINLLRSPGDLQKLHDKNEWLSHCDRIWDRVRRFRIQRLCDSSMQTPRGVIIFAKSLVATVTWSSGIDIHLSGRSRTHPCCLKKMSLCGSERNSPERYKLERVIRTRLLGLAHVRDLILSITEAFWTREKPHYSSVECYCASCAAISRF